MTISEFSAQGAGDRFDTVFNRGFMLLRRSLHERTIVIYAVGNFFVKVKFCKKTNDVLSIEPFTACALPERYFPMPGETPLLYRIPVADDDAWTALGAGWIPCLCEAA